MIRSVLADGRTGVLRTMRKCSRFASDSGETEAAAAVMDPYIVKAAWLIRWYSFSSSAYVELSREDHKC